MNSKSSNVGVMAVTCLLTSKTVKTTSGGGGGHNACTKFYNRFRS